MLTITVTGDFNALRNALKMRRESALRSLESAVLLSCEPYVPYRTGYLASTGHRSGDSVHGAVTWSADYAHDCYYAERPFSKKHHPRACARWFEAAKASDLAAWERLTAREMSGGTPVGFPRTGASAQDA